jgi:hypothetical protein
VIGILVFTLIPRDFMRIMIGTIAVVFALNKILGWARNRPLLGPARHRREVVVRRHDGVVATRECRSGDRLGPQGPAEGR